jgi:hypothetical protein
VNNLQETRPARAVCCAGTECAVCITALGCVPTCTAASTHKHSCFDRSCCLWRRLPIDPPDDTAHSDLHSTAYPPVWLRASKGSNIDRLRAELAAEFRDALLHAYHGPHVDMSARQLPTAFEADERTDPGSPDILQLLSGRCNQWDAPVWQSPHDRPSLQLALEHTAGAACRTCLCEGVRAAQTGSCWGSSGKGKTPFWRAARSLLRSKHQQLLHSSGTAALQRQDSSIPAHTQAATAQTQGAPHALEPHADVPTSLHCMLLRVWCTLQPPLTRI